MVVGSGAGGGVTAEILAQAGLKVAIVEEGPLAGSSEFNMREREAYPRLYQESAGRQTLDKGITLLQGRCVGGGTTVNWTSSFRTPPRTLAHWTAAHGLKSAADGALTPWFERMEARLAIGPWAVPPNENNDVLRRGCEKLGLPSGLIRRNVKGCANLGYCGMGCPTNAKQSMLVTTIPAALDHGATRCIALRRAARLRVRRVPPARRRSIAMVPRPAAPRCGCAAPLRARRGAPSQPESCSRAAPPTRMHARKRTFLLPRGLGRPPQNVRGIRRARPLLRPLPRHRRARWSGGFKLERRPSTRSSRSQLPDSGSGTRFG